MPNHTRMKNLFLYGPLWLFLLHYGRMVLSLEPGFLDFDNLPDTNFTCHGKVIGGYYADIETNCQMFHVCTKGQAGESMDIRFLCLNGTVFDQETRVCERIDEVDCSKSEQFYSLNLELYQNSGPNAEETPDVPPETEAPPVKSSTVTPTTTTTKPSTQPPQYFTTSRPGVTTLSGHHFPVNSPDIRFNPEEINISLNPGGAPPDIRTKHYLQPPQHGGFNSETSKVKVGDSAQRTSSHLSATNTSPQTTVYRPPMNSDVDFGFSEDDFRSTEHPRQQQFLIQTNSFRHSQSFPHSANQYLHPHYHSTTVKQNPSHATTSRTLYIHPLKTSNTHHYRTDKTPQRVQIPILPTIPPLTFSSPAPFSLHHHVEHKRYTKDHHPSPPRIIISASASVSDASGRRLNYSLGTIGETEILEDDYKDSDVTLGGLDPFYHDVPKIKRKRRSVAEEKSPFDIIKSEKEAVEVLKFLFKWYQSHQSTATVTPATSPVSPELIRKINDELSPPLSITTPNSDSEELFLSSSEEVTSTESLKKTTFLDSPPSSIGNKLEFSTPELVVVTEAAHKNITNRMDMEISTPKMLNPDDYIDDNYEGVVAGRSSSLVDPAAASELYKHVNVNNQLKLQESLESNTSSTVNVTESNNIQEKHTEINVLSEVREELGTSTTTAATPKRRGRGRHRYPDNFQEASYTSNQINQISPEINGGKRRRNRGRSRFISTTEHSQLSSSTTTDAAIIDLPSENVTSAPKINKTNTTIPVTSTIENNVPTETSTFSPNTSTFSDPLYLVKLLRYFADTGSEMIYSSPTTDLPKTSYDPLTESQMPYFVTPAIYKDKVTETPVADKSDELLDKLHKLQETLSRIDDTTVTTPVDSFEILESYGTTTAVETTTLPVSDLSVIESNTTSSTTEYYSFYDDIFVVPEVTEKISSVTTTTHATSTAEPDTSPVIVTTSDSSEIEIEKSISLPIDVLSREAAITVNGLISFPNSENMKTQTTVSPFATLIVPSKEITTLEYSTTTEVEPTTSEVVPITSEVPATSSEAVSPLNESILTSSETVATTIEAVTTTTESLTTTVQAVPSSTPVELTSVRFSNDLDNRTEIIFNNLEKPTPSQATSINSSHLQEVVVETTSRAPSASPTRTRSLRRRLNHSQRIGRHRFNTELTTGATVNSENVTEAPLLKSVLPTKTRGQIAKVLLHTTPLSQQSQGRPLKVSKHYVFNCFGKETNKFYADPRDCRLFHYCTQGYSKNQLLDLKYVCDHKTYFDEEKLICTKVKPPKCK